jgi:hypothetical protein
LISVFAIAIRRRFSFDIASAIAARFVSFLRRRCFRSDAFAIFSPFSSCFRCDIFAIAAAATDDLFSLPPSAAAAFAEIAADTRHCRQIFADRSVLASASLSDAAAAPRQRQQRSLFQPLPLSSFFVIGAAATDFRADVRTLYTPSFIFDADDFSRLPPAAIR